MGPDLVVNLLMNSVNFFFDNLAVSSLSKWFSNTDSTSPENIFLCISMAWDELAVSSFLLRFSAKLSFAIDNSMSKIKVVNLYFIFLVKRDRNPWLIGSWCLFAGARCEGVVEELKGNAVNRWMRRCLSLLSQLDRAESMTIASVNLVANWCSEVRAELSVIKVVCLVIQLPVLLFGRAV